MTVIDAPVGDDVIVDTTAGAVVPAWLMVSLPPCRIRRLNVRVFGPRLGVTLRVTIPLPVPEAPETTVIAFGSLFSKFQPQPAPATTLSCSVPPVAGTVELPMLNEGLQLGESWLNVTA